MDKAEDLFETIANYTYDWETWFSQDGTVRWINPAVERMTGYTIGQCLDMADYPLGLTHAEDRKKIGSLLKSAQSGSSGNDVEFRILRKDGCIGWAAVSWQPVHDRNGEELGFRTSVRDITERKRVEDSLRLAKAEAERANAAKTRFLAAVSHDLRQPLQAVSMFLGALKQVGVDDRDRILQDVGACLKNCNELLDDLVDISRLDAGVVVAQIRDVAVADILETVELSLRSSADSKGLALRVVPCSMFVRSDPAVLTRILQNFVANAIRYTRRGRILVGCRKCGGRVVIQVCDTGVGIDESELDHVFEEFYQIDNQQRDRRRGAGLGLAIVRRLADLLDAGLDVRSVPGRGSVFSIAVPISVSTSVPADIVPDPSQGLPLRDTTLLVIDDEPAQLRGMTLLLSVHGANVIAAGDAVEAIEQLQRNGKTPDIIVADYRLAEGQTGAEALQQVMDWLTKPVPGVILTGDTEPQRIAEAKASGYRLLHKPIEPDALMKEINDIRAKSAVS